MRFEKSKDLYSAKIIETEGSNFGRRKVKVRFDNDGKEQFVPIDWLISDQDGNSLAKERHFPTMPCIEHHIRRFI